MARFSLSSVYSTVVKVVRGLWSRFLPSSNLQKKDWSKLSSPNPSAKSRSVAKLPKPQAESAALDENNESAEDILADVDVSNSSDGIDSQDIESELEIESELKTIDPDLESTDQLLESDLSEPELFEQEPEQDLSESTDDDGGIAGDISSDQLSLDINTNTITCENPEETNEVESNQTDVDENEIAQSEENKLVEQEVSTLAEQSPLDLQPEIAESELIVTQQHEDSEINLLLPAIHLPEAELETSSDSLNNESATPPAEVALSSEQPIAEFVSHKLINMEIKHIVEAALFASGSAMSVTRLYRVFDEDERPERSEIRAALTILQQDYADKAVQLVEVAGGFRFQVKADYVSWIARLFEQRPPKYSRALLETLSIIAYRQPVTRGDIENIRGVAVSTHIIQTLQEREWVKVVGHKEVPGKPALFATTTEFLDYFNLKSLTDLPPLSEFIIPDEIPEQPQDPSIEDETDQQNQQAEEGQASQKD